MKTQKIMKEWPFVYAKNAEELLFHSCGKKGLVMEECVAQVFLDSGKDKLTLSVNVFPKDWEQVETPKGRQLSGVNHCIPLGVSPLCQEAHHNFKIYFEKTQIHRLKKFYSLDDKTKGLLCGHQGPSSTRPCVECYTPKEDFATLEQTGEDRTIASVALDCERFEESGGDREGDEKINGNIVLPPQVFGTQEEHKECHDPVGHHLMPS